MASASAGSAGGDKVDPLAEVATTEAAEPME